MLHAVVMLVVLIVGGFRVPSTDATQTPAEILLDRSIDFHDPHSHWAGSTIQLHWSGTDPVGEETTAFEITMSPDGDFAMNGRRRGSTPDYATVGSTMSVRVDGTDEIDDDTRDRMALGRDGGMFWRNYFGYLAGLPMKLRDPGTIIDPEVTGTDFMGRSVQAIRVTYDSDVGGDTWYFYFDPDDAELVGCRFYHDEGANDGEYITLEGLAEDEGLRLPRTRRWYTNSEDRFLGGDVIGGLVVGR